jgi:Domain of unknown function (DUF1839)
MPTDRPLCLITGLDRLGIPPTWPAQDRIWPETNRYTDLWIGVLAALRLEASACLPYTLAVDFLDDQWTQFRPSHDDLYTLYGIEVQTLSLWRPLIDHLQGQLSAGRLVIVDVPARGLPDGAGGLLHPRRTTETIVVNEIDTQRERLGFFHRTDYRVLQGAAYRRLLHPDAPPESEALQGRAEVINLHNLVRRPPDTLRHLSHQLLEKYLQRVPTRHPLRRWRRRFAGEITPLLAGGPTHYQHWADAGPHQLGSAFELAALYLVWIAGGTSGTAHLVQAADAFRQLSVLARSLLLKGARSVVNGQPFQEHDLIERMTRLWSRGMALLGAGEIVLDTPTLVLKPAPAADGHAPATD